LWASPHSNTLRSSCYRRMLAGTTMRPSFIVACAFARTPYARTHYCAALHAIHRITTASPPRADARGWDYYPSAIAASKSKPRLSPSATPKATLPPTASRLSKSALGRTPSGPSCPTPSDRSAPPPPPPAAVGLRTGAELAAASEAMVRFCDGLDGKEAEAALGSTVVETLAMWLEHGHGDDVVGRSM